jgi:hypothetical protein
VPHDDFVRQAAICAVFGRWPKKDFKQKPFGIRFSLVIRLFLGA